MTAAAATVSASVSAPLSRLAAPALFGVLCCAALFLPTARDDSAALSILHFPLLALWAGIGVALAALWARRAAVVVRGVVALALAAAFLLLGAVAMLMDLGGMPRAAVGYWLLLLALLLWTGKFLSQFTALVEQNIIHHPLLRLCIPLVFGLALLLVWEVVTRGANVPAVLLPPPSAIAARFVVSVPILWADFTQTFVKAVVAGYVLGCLSGFLLAVAINNNSFLRRGVLPLGNFISALPIIGIAPIMVMWFGFDWQSKAAVVVVMTFFPMLVNTVTGLNDIPRISRDLMSTYAASKWQMLVCLRLPAAAPFIFNALKINSTLALIGAIVAEFFGTPITGIGFRIATEVGRMNIDMVWAEITLAAATGSVCYGILALTERRVLFWHPAIRRT